MELDHNIPIILFFCIRNTMMINARISVKTTQIMDHSSLPHFCQREGSGSSKNSSNDVNNCFSLDHPFHQELYHYIEEQALNQELIKQGSLHVNIPDQDPEDAKIVEVIEAEFHKLGEQNGSVNGEHKE